MGPPEESVGSLVGNEETHDPARYQSRGCACLSCLFIGRDRSGHWVVKDAGSLCGGLFTNRTEAIRFAMVERQRRPQSVIMLPDGLELAGPLDEGHASGPAKQRAA